MPPSCPGCGASIGTPKFGRHIFGCGYEGEYEDAPDRGYKWKSRWSRGQQREMLVDALDAIGLDKKEALELLREIWADAKNKGKP